MSWVALSKTEHRNKALGPRLNYNYTKNLSMIEISSFELQSAVSNFPIVFVKNNQSVKPYCILGLEENQNLFLTSEGKWDAPLVPAAVKVFPFRMGRLKNGQNLLLFDEKSDLIVEKDKGAPFFDDEGEVTDVVKPYMQLLVSINASDVFLSKACDLIKELDLLEPFSLKIQKSETEALNFGGWMRVNVETFNSLSEPQFLELRRASALGLVFAHLYSMYCMHNLVAKLGDKYRTDSQLKELGSKIFEEEQTIDFNFD